MKRLLNIVLILILSLNLNACGTSKATYSSNNETKVEALPQVANEDEKRNNEISNEDEATISHGDIYAKQQQNSNKSEVKDNNYNTPTTPVQKNIKPEVTQNSKPPEVNKFDTRYNEWGNIRNSNHTTPGIPSIIKPWVGKYNVIFTGDTSRKIIYFTFDAGGETGYANQIMDVLNKHGIKATFFVTLPYITKNPDIVRRMVREGHAVANHTVNHLGLPNLTEEQIKQEYEGVEKEFTKVTGLSMMKCVRPPMGAYSEKSLWVTKQLGYKTIFWSIAYRDYDINNQPSRDEAMSIIQNNHHNGAIMLLHLASKTNAETLDEMILFLKSQGYSFGLIS